MPDDGVDEPLSVAAILRREGFLVPRSVGRALIPRRRQPPLDTPSSGPAVSRTAIAVTGSLLVVGALFGAAVIGETFLGPGIDGEPASALAATPAMPAIPVQRAAPIARSVDQGPAPSVPPSPGAVTAPAVPVQVGPVAAAPGPAIPPAAGPSGAQAATGGKARTTLPPATVAKAAPPPASAAHPTVAASPTQAPAVSVIGDPVKAVQSVGSTAVGVLNAVVGGL